MSTTIWKYTLSLTTTQTFLMPEGAQILCVQKQCDDACLWVLVNPQADKTPRTIALVGTGAGEVKEGFSYIGTTQNIAFVWHWFEVLAERQKEVTHE